MNVIIRIRRGIVLDDVADIGYIYTSSCHVSRNEDPSAACFAKSDKSSLPLGLRPITVNHLDRRLW